MIQDDLHFFLKKVQEADRIMICSPCYFLGEHTVLKKLGDRMLSVLKKGRNFSAKKCVIAVCYGVEGWEGYALEAVHNFASFLHLQVKGKMLVRAANPGEVATPAILQKARDLAWCLLEDRRFEQEREALTCSVCNSSLLQLLKDGTVRCPMCETTGNLQKDGSDYMIIVQEKGRNRFSAEVLTEHAKKLDQIKENYIANRRELKKVRERYAAYDDWWVLPERGKS
ncbi:MAG TPA: flavodoxin family protein [Clostridiales bacterium]|nr:flavodoxin family protein [Clostridiales bacterium]